jgi:aminoglycoside phosphotransferase (APT) family kinase protein
MESSAAALVVQQCLAVPSGVALEAWPLRGGLASAVARVTVRPGSAPLKGLPRTLVVKELLGTHRREADVYRLLWDCLPDPPAARVLGRRDTAEASYLCLEDIRRLSAWPWRNPAAVAAVCHALARIHDAGVPAAGLPAWNYDEDLRASAQETLHLATRTRVDGVLLWRRCGDLRRVVGALARMRERLLETGTTLIHGDVHPGNVIVRAGGSSRRVVLIDWAASRVGSPLEDVASWLHSLGCWDAEARRRHDSLLAVYLRAIHPAARLDAAVRANYWMASASNGLAGAIRYHFAVLVDPNSSSRARRASRHALDEWQRVIRGTAAVL